MPSAADVLRSKGSTIHSIAPTATVLDAIHQMNQHKLGALIVMKNDRVAGMFTERDILRRVLGEERSTATTTVGEVMTKDVICCPPETDLDEVSAIMQQRKIRHVPVCDDDGNLHGLISIGDVNAYHVAHQGEQITFLNEYIYGRA